MTKWGSTAKAKDAKRMGDFLRRRGLLPGGRLAGYNYDYDRVKADYEKAIADGAEVHYDRWMHLKPKSTRGKNVSKLSKKGVAPSNEKLYSNEGIAAIAASADLLPDRVPGQLMRNVDPRQQALKSVQGYITDVVDSGLEHWAWLKDSYNQALSDMRALMARVAAHTFDKQTFIPHSIEFTGPGEFASDALGETYREPLHEEIESMRIQVNGTVGASLITWYLEQSLENLGWI